MSPVDPKAICAIVTAYRPKEMFSKCIETIRNQVGLVIIVNDGGVEQTKAYIDALYGNEGEIEIIHNETNLGVAAALNRGVCLARQYGYTWILTLDDDSVSRPDMVERLCWYVGQINTGKPIGLIGMAWSQRGKNIGAVGKDSKGTWSDKRGLITSGSLFSMETYDIVGPFREEFFVDSVDYDFCLRARSKGFRVIAVNEQGFVHSLGQATIESVVSLKRGLRYSHDRIRLYYQFRNSTTLSREQIFRDPLYSCAVILNHCKTLARIVVFERAKATKVAYALLGLFDGWRGRLGKRFSP